MRRSAHPEIQPDACRTDVLELEEGLFGVDEVPSFAAVVHGAQLEHDIVIIRSHGCMHLIGRHWNGRWRISCWPQDLSWLDLVRRRDCDRTQIARSLDTAIAGLSRAATRADLRALRAELTRRSPRVGDRPWRGLRTLLRLRSFAPQDVPARDMARVLAWIRPESTRWVRLEAFEMEPVAIRWALAAPDSDASEQEQVDARELLAAVDARAPLRRLVLQAWNVRAGDIRWINLFARNWPASMTHFLVDVVLRLPPEHRPTRFESVEQQVEHLSWHWHALFPKRAKTLLPPDLLQRHQILFARSSRHLLAPAPEAGESDDRGRRTTFLRLTGLRTYPERRIAVLRLWRLLRALNVFDRERAHEIVCRLGPDEREDLLGRLRHLAYALGAFQQLVERRVDDVRRERGEPVSIQEWARERFAEHQGTRLTWPLRIDEIRNLGMAMSNCLRSEQGTIAWGKVLRGRQMLVMLEEQQALALFDVIRTRDRITVQLAQLRGRANREVSRQTMNEVHQLCAVLCDEIKRDDERIRKLPITQVEDIFHEAESDDQWDLDLALHVFFGTSCL